jgi:hypothetical protein
MTPSNSTIQTALNDILIAASLGYDIAWPGLPFTPPDTGEWLEVTFLPNRGVDDRLANDGHVSPQGIYQIVCVSRPQSELKLRAVAEQVMAAFPKGKEILFSSEIGNEGATLELDFVNQFYFLEPVFTFRSHVRVGSHPYTGTLRSEADRMSIAVTIEYSE